MAYFYVSTISLAVIRPMADFLMASLWHRQKDRFFKTHIYMYLLRTRTYMFANHKQLLYILWSKRLMKNIGCRQSPRTTENDWFTKFHLIPLCSLLLCVRSSRTLHLIYWLNWGLQRVYIFWHFGFTHLDFRPGYVKIFDFFKDVCDIKTLSLSLSIIISNSKLSFFDLSHNSGNIYISNLIKTFNFEHMTNQPHLRITWTSLDCKTIAFYNIELFFHFRLDSVLLLDQLWRHVLHSQHSSSLCYFTWSLLSSHSLLDLSTNNDPRSSVCGCMRHLVHLHHHLFCARLSWLVRARQLVVVCENSSHRGELH